MKPAKGKRFFFPPKRPDWFWDSPSLIFSGCRVFIPPVVNRLGREFNHPSPTNSKVTNEWNYTSTPPIRLHGVDRGNITYLYAHRNGFPRTEWLQVITGTWVLQRTMVIVCLLREEEHKKRREYRRCWVCNFRKWKKSFMADFVLYIRTY